MPKPSARATIIRQVMDELDEIDAQMKQLRERKAEIKRQRIRRDLQMAVADFEFLRKIRAMNADRRTLMLETLTEGLDALGFLHAPEVAEAPPEAPPAAPPPREIVQANPAYAGNKAPQRRGPQRQGARASTGRKRPGGKVARTRTG